MLIGTLRRLRRGVPDPWVLVMITCHAEWALYWAVAFEGQNNLLTRRIEDADEDSSSSTLSYGPVAEEAEEEVLDADVVVDIDTEEFDLFGLMEFDVLLIDF